MQLLHINSAANGKDVDGLSQKKAAVSLRSRRGLIGDIARNPFSYLLLLPAMAYVLLFGYLTYPYRLVIPAIVISLIVLSLNLFGDGLRDAFDPKLKK